MSDEEPQVETTTRRRRPSPSRVAFDRDLADVQRQAAELGIGGGPSASEEAEAAGEEDPMQEAEPAPPARNYGFGRASIPDGQSPGTAPGVTAEETGLIKLLDDQIKKLRNDPQSFVSAWRVRPEFVDGKPAAGMSGKWSVAALRSAEDLLQQIEAESGGHIYQIRFSGYNASKKKVMPLRTFGNVPINAEPLLRGQHDKKNGSNGNVISPDVEITKQVLEAYKGLLADKVGGGQEGRAVTEMLKTMREMGSEQTNFLLQQMQEMRTRVNPSAEVIAKVQEESKREVAKVQEDAKRELDRARDRWDEERARLTKDHEAERKDLNRQLTAQIEKITEKLESAQDKLKEREEAFGRERTERERSFDERLKHREELHQRDMQRLSDQLSDERRSTEKLKDMYELAKNTALDKQEGIFKEQAKGQENRIAHLEERIRDLEKQKEELQKDLAKATNEAITARTTKGDPLSSAMETFTAIGSMAGKLGWEKAGSGGKESPGEMRTEIGQLAKDMKDSGVIDAARGVLEKVTDKIAERRMPQQGMQVQGMQPGMFPPGTFPIQVSPMYQGGFQPQMPMQQQPMYVPPAPQQQPPVSPAPAPAPVQVAQAAAAEPPAPPAPPAPPEPSPTADTPLTEAEVAAFAVAVKRLEDASDNGQPVADVAKAVLADVPWLYLKDVVEPGVGAFQSTIRQVLKFRPEDPESILLTPRGESWLHDLFGEIERQRAAS